MIENGGEKVIRKNSVFLTMLLLVVVLAGCGQTVEGQTDMAIKQARDTFEMDRKKVTESVEGVEFYKPTGFKADVQKEQRIFTLSKGNKKMMAEFDPNAKSDSRVFYELLMADTNKVVIQEQTFTDNGVFGFVVISAHGEDSVEIVTGVGPVEVKAIVKKEELSETANQMMTIARSFQIDNEK